METGKQKAEQEITPEAYHYPQPLKPTKFATIRSWISQKSSATSEQS